MVGRGSPVRLRQRRQLASAARRLGGLSVAAQTGDPHSTLELYRAALRIRRERDDLGAGDSVHWLEAPEGVLAFRRGAFTCTVNTTGEPVRMPLPGTALLASAELTDPDVLPGDTAVWWQG